MKYFFDSSVLVSVFYADHPDHASSAKLFLGAGKDGFCALRTLGEVYATLTRLPLRPRITGADGAAIVKQICDRLSLVSLNEQEYISALDRQPRAASLERLFTTLSSHSAQSKLTSCLPGMCAISPGWERMYNVS